LSLTWTARERNAELAGEVIALPTFHSDGALVDIADRDAPYHAMEGHYSKFLIVDKCKRGPSRVERGELDPRAAPVLDDSLML
jgi:hypothetical protein